MRVEAARLYLNWYKLMLLRYALDSVVKNQTRMMVLVAGLDSPIHVAKEKG